MSQHTAVLLLGSNLGDTKKNIETAVEILSFKGFVILTQSEFLYTQPVEFASINIFCNIALLIKTQFSPVKLLNCIKKIEQQMGRKEDTKAAGSYTDRVIDIDIVYFDNIIFKSNKLIIPHYRHQFERDFSARLLKNLFNKHNI